MAVLKSTDDIPTIESKIGGGQVEQLIEQAKDELSLIPKLIAARAFDPYNGSPAEEILTDLKRCSPPAARLSRWPCSTHLGPAAHLTLGPALRLPECPGVAWRCRGTTSRCAHRRTTLSRRRSSWSCLPCLRPQRRLKCITESSAARDTCTSDPPPLCPATWGVRRIAPRKSVLSRRAGAGLVTGHGAWKFWSNAQSSHLKHFLELKT